MAGTSEGINLAPGLAPRRLRDEQLNVELFFSVPDPRTKVLEWQRGYNEVRPHGSLGNISPREFAAQWQLNQAAAHR